jgi:hypothetical protein
MQLKHSKFSRENGLSSWWNDLELRQKTITSFWVKSIQSLEMSNPELRKEKPSWTPPKNAKLRLELP